MGPDHEKAGSAANESLSSAHTMEPGQESEKRQPWARLGIILILLSGVLWFSLFAIPFLPVSNARRVVIAGVVFAGVQVAWWSGAALAGPRVVGAIRSWFRWKKTGSQ